MVIPISSEQLKERYILIYRENPPADANPYTKIKVDNFVDKTGVGLAKKPSAAFPDGLAGTIIPVTGGGLVYSDISGKLSLDLPTDTLNFVGFIFETDQKPDNGLQAGDFYIVNGENITIKVSDWPGIDDSITPVFTITESKPGSNYRANTGTIQQLQGYADNRPPGQPNDLTFDGDIIGGNLASVSLVNGGTGYENDQVVDVTSAADGGSGSGGQVKINGVDENGSATSIEVFASGNSFRLGVGAAGTMNPVLAEGGSGTGMKLTGDILEGNGVPANVVIVDEGYGYEDGDIVTLPGSSTDSAEYELSITGNGDVSVNLGDRVFYKKDGTFVLVPDVVGTQTIMELLPDAVADQVPYFFKDNPDKQHLLLHINEAKREDDGNYQPGLISGPDKEKLDNIALNANQGRVWEITTNFEPNYIEPENIDVEGVNPLRVESYGMLATTGDPVYQANTLGYDINILNSQKLLTDSSDNIIAPRNRGVVFLAEEDEIEDLINYTTIGSSVSSSAVINAEDTIKYLTQKDFTTLPPYEQILLSDIGQVEIVGPTEVASLNNTILTARVFETGYQESELEYTWTISDTNNIIDEQAINGNSAYISFKGNVGGQSVTTTVVVSVKDNPSIDTITDTTTVNVVLQPTSIGLIDLSTPPSGFRGLVSVPVTFTVEIKGTDPTTDIEFVIDELDSADYLIEPVDGTLSANITFYSPSTNDIADTDNYYNVEVRAYSENAIDADKVDEDGKKYSSKVFGILIDGTVTNPEVVLIDGQDPTVGEESQFRLTYEGEASLDDVGITFETDGTIQVDSPNEDILNMFDGDDTTYTLVSTAGEVDFIFPGPLVSTDFALMTFEVMSPDADTTLEVWHTDNNGQPAQLSTHALTANNKVTIQATANSSTDDLGEITLRSATDVYVYKMTYDGDDVIKYAADEVTTEADVATIKFGAPGYRKITATSTYQDEVQHAELDITVNS